MEKIKAEFSKGKWIVLWKLAMNAFLGYFLQAATYGEYVYNRNEIDLVSWWSSH